MHRRLHMDNTIDQQESGRAPGPSGYSARCAVQFSFNRRPASKAEEKELTEVLRTTVRRLASKWELIPEMFYFPFPCDDNARFDPECVSVRWEWEVKTVPEKRGHRVRCFATVFIKAKTELRIHIDLIRPLYNRLLSEELAKVGREPIIGFLKVRGEAGELPSAACSDSLGHEGDRVVPSQE